MHRTVCAAALVGACLVATPVLAADMARPVYKAAPAVAPFSWTGFYLGGHAGYGWGGADGSIVANNNPGLDNPGAFNLDGDGIVGGIQLGYNWQIAPSWVIGLEADFSGTGIRGSAFQPGSTSGTPNQGWQHHMNRDVEWLATARGRVGYAWDRALLFVTGGFAWAKVNDEAFTTAGTVLFPASLDSTRSGWTIGGGLEWAFASNWSAKVEYLYYALDGGSAVGLPSPVVASSTTNSWDDINLHVVRAGVNYRFGDSARSAYAYAPDLSRAAAPAATHHWTGFYVGGHAGYGWGDTDTSIPANGLLYDAAAFRLRGDGAVAGAQIGYNWQVAPHWVVGLEADLSGTGIGDQVLATQTILGAPRTAGFTHFMSRDINWLATVRGRVGYTWERTLAYVTGGAAFGDIHYEAATAWNGFGFTPASFSKVRSGWTLGGGLEWAVAENWTVKLEYLYYNLDGTSIVAQGNASRTAPHNWDDTQVSVVRAGVNYRFGAY